MPSRTFIDMLTGFKDDKSLITIELTSGKSLKGEIVFIGEDFLTLSLSKDKEGKGTILIQLNNIVSAYI